MIQIKEEIQKQIDELYNIKIQKQDIIQEALKIFNTIFKDVEEGNLYLHYNENGTINYVSINYHDVLYYPLPKLMELVEIEKSQSKYDMCKHKTTHVNEQAKIEILEKILDDKSIEYSIGKSYSHYHYVYFPKYQLELRLHISKTDSD